METVITVPEPNGTADATALEVQTAVDAAVADVKAETAQTDAAAALATADLALSLADQAIATTENVSGETFSPDILSGQLDSMSGRIADLEKIVAEIQAGPAVEPARLSDAATPLELLSDLPTESASSEPAAEILNTPEIVPMIPERAETLHWSRAYQARGR